MQLGSSITSRRVPFAATRDGFESSSRLAATHGHRYACGHGFCFFTFARAEC
jgi:hypothetical protein